MLNFATKYKISEVDKFIYFSEFLHFCVATHRQRKCINSDQRNAGLLTKCLTCQDL